MRSDLPHMTRMALAFVLVLGACTDKKDGGGGGGNKESTDAITDDGSSDGSSNGSSAPCLRLDDILDEEGASDTTSTDSAVGTSAVEDPCSETGSNTGGTNGSSSSWHPGPGLESCNSQGLSWVAVANGGPGQCGESLVDWCCTENEIARRFPGLASQISAQFDTYRNLGLKLYNCSTNGSRTTFHWTYYQNDAIQYRSVNVDAAPTEIASPNNCIMVTSSELGIPTGTITDGESDATGGTGTDSSTVTSIGDISDITKAGLLAWLKAGSYRSWTARDNAIRTSSSASPHGRVKAYYSTQVANTLSSSGSVFEKGSIVVQEHYDTANKLTGYSLKAKGLDAPATSSWMFYKVIGTAPDFINAPVDFYGAAQSLCVSCHKAATAASDRAIVQKAAWP